MDNFRPTIVVSELVASRKDCASTYFLISRLKRSLDAKENESSCGREQFVNRRNFAQWEGMWLARAYAKKRGGGQWHTQDFRTPKIVQKIQLCPPNRGLQFFGKI